MKKTNLYIVSVIILLFLILLNIKKTTYFEKTFKVIDTFLPTIVSSSLRMIADNKLNSSRIKNDYNVNFLPNTQFNKMKFSKINLDFIKITEIGYLNILKRKTFYIDFHKNNLIVMPKNGNFYYKSMNDLKNSKINFKQIKSDLKLSHALDLFIKDEKVYVSYVKKTNECAFLHLDKADFNFKFLKFKNIFKNKECMNLIQAGRIQKITEEGQSFILLSTQSHTLEKDDERDYKPQDNNSIYGKILSINENDKSFKIFSKGHRNVLGLFADDNVILATENGPRGGDEINKIMETILI